MKKIFAAFISLSLIFSLGCSRKIDQGSENIKENDKGQVSENENIEEITDTEDVNTEDVNIEDANIEEVNTEEYEELSKIAEKINVQDYNMYVESDNKGTRIILFEKDGINVYKSIFVKGKSQLKLIDLKSGEKPLINERI